MSKALYMYSIFAAQKTFARADPVELRLLLDGNRERSCHGIDDRRRELLELLRLRLGPLLRSAFQDSRDEF